MDKLFDQNFWESMREEGFIATDFPGRKTAIYANNSGQVVIVGEDDNESVVLFSPEEIETVVKLLLKAKPVAMERESEIEAEYALYCAKGG